MIGVAKPILLMLLLWSLSGCSHNSSIDERLQTVLDRNILRCDAHGVSAAVIFPDKQIWTGTSGISHDTVAMEPDMLFAIGSITKNVMAGLTLRLAEEGILSLDDQVGNWLPHFAHVDDAITIRQLLNHTSGLYMFWENQDLWDALKADRARVWTPEDVLAYIKEPDFAPGGGWRYSNTNYLLLGMIIEKATGSTLATEIRRQIWEPLGIQDAYLSIQETLPANQAHVYGDNFMFGEAESDLTFEPRASHDSIAFGSSGVFTSAECLARWCHALFEGEVLDQASMRQMLQFENFRPVANMRAYGLGVQKYPRAFASGKEAIGHGGGNIGTTSYMVHLPNQHISIVVMVNEFPTTCADAIAKGLIRVTLREHGVIGWFPYISLFPHGFIIVCITTSLIGIAVVHLKKRRSRTG